MTSEKEKQEAKERIEFRAALDNRVIRDFIWKTIAKGNIHAINGPQSVETANYLSGKRDMANQMIQEIAEISPDHWILMQNENNESENNG